MGTYQGDAESGRGGRLGRAAALVAAGALGATALTGVAYAGMSVSGEQSLQPGDSMQISGGQGPRDTGARSAVDGTRGGERDCGKQGPGADQAGQSRTPQRPAVPDSAQSVGL